MQDLIVRDVRLVGTRPAGNEVLEVDQNTPLTWPIQWVLDKATAYRGDVRVRLMAHGAPGYGLIMGSQGIHLTIAAGDPATKNPAGAPNTVDWFFRWYGKVKQIDILGCGIAYINPGLEGKFGDGNFLCMRFAQITQAYVKASTATQQYTWKADIFGVQPIDFGPWEGTVLTYSPNGGVVAKSPWD